MIVIDEIESILFHLDSPYMSEYKTQICNILWIILKNAKWIISLDADFSDRAYSFLYQLNNNKIFSIIINEYKQNIKRFCFCTNQELRKYQIFEDIKNNKNIVIICLSKDKMDELYSEIIKIIDETKILRYSSMTDDI